LNPENLFASTITIDEDFDLTEAEKKGDIEGSFGQGMGRYGKGVGCCAR
jgi:hypothetical protein